MNIFSKITLQNLKKNRIRTIVTIIGIILSTAMFTAVTTTISSLHHFMVDYTIYNNGSWHAADYEMTASDIEEYGNDSEIAKLVYLQHLGFARIEESKNEYKPYLCVEGVESNVTDLLPVHLIEGRMPTNEKEILLPKHLEENGLVEYKIGDTLTLSLGLREDLEGNVLYNHDAYTFELEILRYTDTRTYTVVGIYERPSFEEFSAPGYTALTIADENTDAYTYDLYFALHDVKDTITFVEKRIEAQEFLNGSKYNNDLLRLYSSSGEGSLNATMYGLAVILIFIIMLGSISLIYNAFSISVNERTKQFGVLASIGATRRQLQKSVLTEGLFLAIIGIPLGLFAGMLGMGITFIFVGDTLSELVLGDCPITVSLHVSFIALLIAVFIALLTILISAYIPARRAMKRSAIDIIRQSEDIKLRSKQIRTSRIVQKIFGFEGMLAAKHYKRNRKKYRATVISLFISVVLFISASSFCSYLQTGADIVYPIGDFNIWVDVYGKNSKEDLDIQALVDDIGNITDVKEVHYNLSFITTLCVNKESLSKEYMNMLSEMYGTKAAEFEEEILLDTYVVFLDDDDFRKYAEKNNLDASDYFVPSSPKALLVNKIGYYGMEDDRYHRLSTFSSLKDADLSFALACEKDGASYMGYTVNKGEFLWDYYSEEEEKDFLIPWNSNRMVKPVYCDAIIEQTPSSFENEMYPVLYYPYSQMEYVLPSKDIKYENIPQLPFEKSMNYTITVYADNHATTTAAITDYLSTYPNIYSYVLDYEEISEGNRATMFVVNVFSYGFIILISLISMANVFNTISTNIALRRREFAMLRSVGLEPRGMMRMMNFECLLYGFKGLLYGLPTGILVTWWIYYAISNGVVMKFYIPWYSLVIAIGSVFVVVFATMIYSVKKLRKENTVEALTNENF